MIHIHKWKPMYASCPPRLVSFLGAVGTTRTKPTGIERCSVCGKRQKDRSMLRELAWVAAFFALSSYVSWWGFSHGHQVLGAIAVVAGAVVALITLILAVVIS